MCRHSSRQALIQKIRDGAMGQVQLIRAYRMEAGYRIGPRAVDRATSCSGRSAAWAFLWASSGIFIELMIHQIDECCWIKDAWPVSAHGVGGRAANSDDCGQNLDSYSIEYTFADGTKAMVNGRYMPNCHNEFATFVHGTKCAAQFSVGCVADPPRSTRTSGSTADNIDWKPEPESESLAGRMERAAGRDPQRPAAQRGPARGLRQPGLDHGPGGRPLRQAHHLGRGDGLELPVLPERRRPHGRQPRARPRRRPGPLPGPDSRPVVGDLTQMTNLPPLTSKMDKGAEGGHEFERLMNQLLLCYADRHGFEYEPAGSAGGDRGIDGLARRGGVPGFEGPVAF